MAKNTILDKIDSPEDLKKIDISLLPDLSIEIKNHITEIVEDIGGHFSSPLGVIDLTIALHYAYNSPFDKLIWDVGHQAYAHKILTGRRDVFKTLRMRGGISGFLKRDESPHDIFGAGHSSTSISAALGFAHARDMSKEKNQVVAIIGDGAMTGGLAYEGMNNLGYHKTQLTVILNDNSHSISKSVGALSHYLTRIVTNPRYNKIRNDIWKISGKLPLSSYLRKVLKKTEGGIKGYLTPGTLFEELGMRYIGPIDGHDIEGMINVLKSVRKMNTPVLLHVFTQKGKGDRLAENDAIKYYSLKGKYENKVKTKSLDYSQVFGHSIKQLAKEDGKIICVTAAMEIGTGILPFINKFPDRYVDVGIAEEHAVTYSAGLSASGYKPIVPIYSTFMQRAYDQIIHDCLLQKLPIIFCMDRSGLVGPDGPTHHGVNDIAFMYSFPGMIVTAPKDGNELRNLIATAIKTRKPFSIRYPKADCRKFILNGKPEIIEVGKWEIVNKGINDVILAVGPMVGMLIDGMAEMKKTIGYLPTIINARFIKPMDTELLHKLCREYDKILTIEEGILIGGFGSAVNDFMMENKYDNTLFRLGIPDKFINHGDRKDLLEDVGLSLNNISSILKAESLNEEHYER